MDSFPLVAEQIADGQRLVERLVQSGFPVAAACWAMTPDDGQWYLYLVSPAVDAKGPLSAYGRILSVVRELEEPTFGVEPMQVKLIGPSEPLGRGLVEFNEQSGTKKPTRHPGGRIGDATVEAAYIYPPLVATE
jgi:hypothetical protein